MKWGACFWNHFSKYSSFDSRGDAINPKFGQKRPKLVFHVPIVIERWKSRVQRNLRCSIRFWNLYLKILKFWLPVVKSSTQKWVKKVQIGEKDERKMKTKSKRYFEVNYLLMKPFSKNLEVLTQQVTFLTQNWLEKEPKLVSHGLIERWKSKVKGALKWDIRSWNSFIFYIFYDIRLFSRNLEILAPCCGVIKTQNLYIMYNWR